MAEVKLCKICDGCGACANVCKFQALTVKKNEKGFFVAVFDEKKCKSCGLCEKVCEKKATSFETSLKVLIAKAKDTNTLMNSSSGGVFTVLTDVVLGNGGVVYGVAFGKNFAVEHIRAEDKTTRDKMRGSKYVQSNLKDSYQAVKKDLLEGREVLFSGTPCQIDGLKAFLKTARVAMNGLTTCEVICNGVSSPKLWDRYLKKIVKPKRVSNIFFRYKSEGIKGSIFVSKRKNGFLDARGYYTKLYTSGNCLSESCYQCRYAKKIRTADITIGDMQGTFLGAVELEKEYGLSVVLLNTGKGLALWDKAKHETAYQDITEKDYEQKRLVESVKKPQTADQFWEDESKYSMRKLLKKYAGRTLFEGLSQLKTSLLISKRRKK